MGKQREEPSAPHPHQGCSVWGILSVFGEVWYHCPLVPPTGAPVPPGLSQLFEVLQDLEGCHRLLSPSPPVSPALLELQT